jgi:hypothetical protein
MLSPPETPAQSSGSASSSQLQKANPINSSNDIYLITPKSTHHPIKIAPLQFTPSSLFYKEAGRLTIFSGKVIKIY